jgi:class 3 adenylate cyclase/tetratricopeptide (TPR) repeat protein
MAVLTCPNCGQENPDGFRFCGACATRLAPEVPGRRKLATLLFCDMSGSTAMGERVDAESVRDMMFRYFDEMRGALERHGGTVEKFIGDAVVAVFGVPVAHEDDALRAVRAAAEMQERLITLNDELERRFGNRIALRIGVNTGEVIAGDASSRETIVTGDTVNVAARLEQAAQPGEILVGESTYRLVRHAVTAEATEPLRVKGKSELLAAYRLVHASVGAASQARRLDAPLVGRTDELEVLRNAFVEVVENKCCKLVTVVGEPGVGKSRLAAELLSAVGVKATVLRGRCLPYGEGITYWAVAELVRQAAGIHDEHSQEQAQSRLASLLAGEDDVELVSRRVGQAIGLSSGGVAAGEIAWAIRRLFETLAHRRPLTLLIDDIHWAEKTLLDLLAGIPKLAQGAPILLLCLARPELVEEWPEWTPSIRLEPLDEGDMGRLIQNLLGEATTAPEVLERIMQAGAGNPLFVEELVAMLIDERLVRRQEGSWVATQELAAVEVPTTVNALLGARLDRLPEAERAAIERGAIEGELFHRGAVAELSPPGARLQVATHLDALVGRELLRPAPASFVGEAAFRFRHILIRDAAYRATAKKLRADLHERFANWLERTAGGRLAEYEEICGYHLEQAYRYRVQLGPIDERGNVLAKRAAERLGAAGGRGLRRGDKAGKALQRGRAVALLPVHEPTRLQFLPKLGSALARIGELGRADAVLTEAIDGAIALGDQGPELLAMVERVSWRLWTDPWSRDEARGVAERAIRVFEDTGDMLGLAKAWHLLGDVESKWGANTEALERALVYSRRGGDRREEADILWWLAVSLYFGPTHADEGIRRCEQILEEAKGDRTVEAGTLGILAGLNGMRGCFGEARELFARSIAILEELGVKLRMASRRTISGAVELLADDPSAAERELRWGFERLEEMGEHQDLPGIAAQLAEALYRQGRYDEAEPFAAISEAEEHERTRWRGPRAKLLARRGELERAEELARAATTVASQADNSNSYGNTLMDLAEVLRLAGRADEAVSPLQDALRVYEEKGNVVAAAKARAALDELSAPTSPAL